MRLRLGLPLAFLIVLGLAPAPGQTGRAPTHLHEDALLSTIQHELQRAATDLGTLDPNPVTEGAASPALLFDELEIKRADTSKTKTAGVSATTVAGKMTINYLR